MRFQRTPDQLVGEIRRTCLIEPPFLDHLGELICYFRGPNLPGADGMAETIAEAI